MNGHKLQKVIARQGGMMVDLTVWLARHRPDAPAVFLAQDRLIGFSCFGIAIVNRKTADRLRLGMSLTK